LITIRGTRFSGYILVVWALKAGRDFTKVTASRSAPEFADHLDIAARCPTLGCQYWAGIQSSGGALRIL
jgi:hypothetical protein